MKSQARFIWSSMLVLSVLLVVAVLNLVWQWNRPPTFYGGVIEPPKELVDFSLQSTTSLVHLSDFRGKYVILAFGYTSCPDVCPTVLADLGQAFAKLDPAQSERFQVIFVSVDYKRDTPDQVAAYVQNFQSDFLGLGGSQEQIDQVTGDYGIYYQLNQPDPKTGFYTVDHSAVVLVIDPDGRLMMTWPFDMQVDKITADLKALARLNK